MSVTGIILFVIFLLVTNLLDKKKRKARQQRQSEALEPPVDLRETATETQGAAQSEEMQALLHRFFSAQEAASEEPSAPRAAAAVHTASSLVIDGVDAPPHKAVQRQEMEQPPREPAASGALALDFTPAAMLQAAVLAEVIGRPKAQRGRSPYFRP